MGGFGGGHVGGGGHSFGGGHGSSGGHSSHSFSSGHAGGIGGGHNSGGRGPMGPGPGPMGGPHRPYGPMGMHGPRAYFWGPRWFYWGPGWGYSYHSFIIGRLFSILLMGGISAGCAYGAFSMQSFNNRVVETTYTITDKSDLKSDYSGEYYTYTLSWDYQGNSYTDDWDDDYKYTNIGDTGIFYIDADDPGAYNFDDPSYSKAEIVLVYGLCAVFGITFVTSIVSLAGHGRNNSAKPAEGPSEPYDDNME